MTNTNPQTGIRYGVIACNSLDQDVVNDLFYGSGATDVSYEAAYEEAKAEAQREYASLLEEAAIAAAESGADREADYDPDEFIEDWFADNGHDIDEEQFVQDKLEAFSDMCQIDEPHITGTCDGVTYQITWLGGAPLLWVLEGPLGFVERLCSPCIPGAGDMDSSFEPTDLKPDQVPVHWDGYLCYVVPRDWLADESLITTKEST
jgi:hypothetical protein